MIYLPNTDIYSTMPHLVIRNTTPITWTRDVEGRDGYYLKGEIPSAFTALEYRVGGVGSWVDLISTPLLLTPYIGLRQLVEFRLTSASFTEDDRQEMIVYCSP